MRYLASIVVFIAVIVIPQISVAKDVMGLWLTQNGRSVIEIKRCDDGVCGRVYWITEGGLQYDKKNPDPELRKRSMCGLQILSGFEEKSDTAWRKGQIYKADDGDVYKAKLDMVDAGTLKVRGYIGIPALGKTQTWLKVNPAEYPRCRKP